MSEDSLEILADRLTPLIADRLLTTISVFGDRNRVHLGKNVNLVNAMFNVVSGDVWIGDETFCGHNVCFITGTHDIEQFGLERQRAYPADGRNIVIGKGVWLASNVTVIGPVTVGDDAVIASGSVVIKDVPDRAVVGGCPARIIRHIEP